MKNVLISVMLGALVFNSGCTMLNYNASKKELVTMRMQAATPEQRQTALKFGILPNGTFGASLDLFDPSLMDVIALHPVRAIAAAAGDIAILTGATMAISGSFNKSDTSQHTSAINLTGNQNVVNQGSGSITIGHSQPMSNGDGTGTQAGGDSNK